MKNEMTKMAISFFILLAVFSGLNAENFPIDTSLNIPDEEEIVATREFVMVERRISEAIPPFKGCPDGNEFIAPVNEQIEKEVLRLVNIERQKRKLVALKWSEELARSARYHASDMAAENYFSHDSQDNEGQKYKSVCSTFKRIGAFSRHGHAENIAAGYSEAEKVMRQWMNSPGHKANILRENSRVLGVGYYSDPESRFRHYWVQNFGRGE